MRDGMTLVVVGQVTKRETKTSKKSGNPYHVVEFGWLGGSSGDLFVRDEELARIPPLGTAVMVTFEAKAGRDGVRAGKLEDVQVQRMTTAGGLDSPPLPAERSRARAA